MKMVLKPFGYDHGCKTGLLLLVFFFKFFRITHQLLEVDEIIMKCFVSLVNKSDIWREREREKKGVIHKHFSLESLAIKKYYMPTFEAFDMVTFSH